MNSKNMDDKMYISNLSTLAENLNNASHEVTVMIGKYIGTGNEEPMSWWTRGCLDRVNETYGKLSAYLEPAVSLSVFQSFIDIAGNDVPVEIHYEVCDGDVLLYHAFAGKTDITALVCGDAWADYKEQILESFRQENISNAG